MWHTLKAGPSWGGGTGRTLMRPGRAPGSAPTGGDAMDTDVDESRRAESRRAWLMISGILAVIFADLLAIILMNTVGT